MRPLATRSDSAEPDADGAVITATAHSATMDANILLEAHSRSGSASVPLHTDIATHAHSHSHSHSRGLHLSAIGPALSR